VQTGEEYFQEISNLTQEIKKLAQFKDMLQHKIILPIGKLFSLQSCCGRKQGSFDKKKVQT
jgi:hypothetical protein